MEFTFDDLCNENPEMIKDDKNKQLCLCAISGKVMKDPVCIGNQYYDRTEILMFLENYGNKDPLGNHVDHSQIVPADAARQILCKIAREAEERGDVE